MSLVCASVVLAPARLLSQTATAGLRHIRVEDADGRGLPSVLVEVLAGKRSYSGRTDSLGQVSIRTDSNETAVMLKAQRLGFAPFASEVVWPPDGMTTVIMLDVATLETVKVNERAPSVPRLSGADARIAAKIPNASVTREEIDQRNPIALSQLLRRMAGIRIVDSLGTKLAISSRGMKMERLRPVPCVLRVNVDGVILPEGTDLDQIPPIEVHAIEVYFGPARIPPELAGSRRDAWCGLIAIWTRGG
ncbi:MAG: TonB-dependent receptor plug domain-containing protein [Gemmatimonadaceae bacterium]|nr:TonB-dependent receptor plug domain-containing protein [Gemmatimonadaceae bacterium]